MAGYILIYLFMTRHEVHSTQSVCVHNMDFVSGHKQIN